jgi:hypothetical protein
MVNGLVLVDTKRLSSCNKKSTAYMFPRIISYTNAPPMFYGTWNNHLSLRPSTQRIFLTSKDAVFYGMSLVSVAPRLRSLNSRKA